MQVKIRNSIKNINNVNDFYFQLKAVIPKINNDAKRSLARDEAKASSSNKYYFVLLFEDNISYKTDYLLNTNINEAKELNIDINDYLRKRKTSINMYGEYTKQYYIDDMTLQDLLYYVLDDQQLFYHNKFTNIYYPTNNIMISKQDNYYTSILFTKYFKLREYIDDVYIEVNKIKRKYNKLNKSI